eukprot:scaffold16396_cov115-Isochrysis_galbana.AAC.2
MVPAMKLECPTVSDVLPSEVKSTASTKCRRNDSNAGATRAARPEGARVHRARDEVVRHALAMARHVTLSTLRPQSRAPRQGGPPRARRPRDCAARGGGLIATQGHNPRARMRCCPRPGTRPDRRQLDLTIRWRRRHGRGRRGRGSTVPAARPYAAHARAHCRQRPCLPQEQGLNVLFDDGCVG